MWIYVGDGYRLAVMAWSDNLFAFGACIEDALDIMADWADAMHEYAGYSIKADSLEVTVSSTRRFAPTVVEKRGRTWQVRDHLSCLGFCISSVGDTTLCRNKFFQQLRGCFWANSRVLLNRCVPASHRLRWWRTLCKGFADYKFGLWPFKPSVAKLVDGCSFQLLCSIVAVRPLADGTAAAFCIRRNRLVHLEAIKSDLILSEHWSFKTVTWIEHLLRHESCPAARLLQQQTPEWLETCRILSGLSLHHRSDRAGVTMTRSGRGPPIRYLGEWWREICFDNPCIDKGISRQRAVALRHFRPS